MMFIPEIQLTLGAPVDCRICRVRRNTPYVNVPYVSNDAPMSLVADEVGLMRHERVDLRKIIVYGQRILAGYGPQSRTLVIAEGD